MHICVRMEPVHDGKQVLRLTMFLQHGEEAVTGGQEKDLEKSKGL